MRVCDVFAFDVLMHACGLEQRRFIVTSYIRLHCFYNGGCLYFVVIWCFLIGGGLAYQLCEVSVSKVISRWIIAEIGNSLL